MEQQPDRTHSGHEWLAFTPDTNDDYAVTRFVKRFGHPPAFVMIVAGLKIAGPIERGECR